MWTLKGTCLGYILPLHFGLAFELNPTWGINRAVTLSHRSETYSTRCKGARFSQNPRAPRQEWHHPASRSPLALFEPRMLDQEGPGGGFCSTCNVLSLD